MIVYVNLSAFFFFFYLLLKLHLPRAPRQGLKMLGKTPLIPTQNENRKINLNKNRQKLSIYVIQQNTYIYLRENKFTNNFIITYSLNSLNLSLSKIPYTLCLSLFLFFSKRDTLTLLSITA